MASKPFVPFAINMQGVAPSGIRVDLPLGAFKVQIGDLFDWEKVVDGVTSFSAMMEVTVVEDGDYKGAPAMIFLGKDATKKGNIQKWRAAYQSVGAPIAALDQGQITVDATNFKGKLGYLYNQPGAVKADGTRALGDSYLVTREVYESFKKNQANLAAAEQTVGNGAGAGQATQQQAAAPQVQTGGNQPVQQPVVQQPSGPKTLSF